ncbi:MAG: hypothetical protein KatS3mg031_1336 [Chitinophagales bacterium]|nr:MAG: hypothetical protein KatS3mg031_1336 [Chitinophagales bacterium]
MKTCRVALGRIMKRLLLLLIICLTGVVASAQYDYDYDKYDLKQKPKRERERDRVPKQTNPNLSNWNVGGFINAGFSSDLILVDLSPIVTYRPIHWFEAGAGFLYQYINLINYFPAPYERFNKYHTFGGRVFPRAYVWKNLFLQPEYMLISGQGVVYDYFGHPVGKFRKSFHNAFAGAGYNFDVSDRAYLTMLISVNLTTNELMPYRRPIYSFGFQMRMGRAQN